MSFFYSKSSSWAQTVKFWPRTSSPSENFRRLRKKEVWKIRRLEDWKTHCDSRFSGICRFHGNVSDLLKICVVAMRRTPWSRNRSTIPSVSFEIFRRQRPCLLVCGSNFKTIRKVFAEIWRLYYIYQFFLGHPLLMTCTKRQTLWYIKPSYGIALSGVKQQNQLWNVQGTRKVNNITW